MALIKIEPYIVDATGDFTFNNVTATGNLSALNANLGNAVTDNYFIGSAANLTNIPGGNISGTVSVATTPLWQAIFGTQKCLCPQKTGG